MSEHVYDKELEIFYHEHEDACTKCGYAFQNNDTIYIGYLKGRHHAVLCEKCSHLMEETQRKVAHSEREYEKPSMTDKLWRYMDLSKFISLISTNSLFFAAAYTFNDPFEGAKGSFSNKDKWDSFYRSFIEYAICNPPAGMEPPTDKNKIREDQERLLQEFANAGEMARKHTFISCWHQNEFESEAMWNLYSNDKTNAIAIQTTVQNLYLSLDRDPSISIGKVKYIDFNKRYASINGAFWYKRFSFEHEHEVRAITKDYAFDGLGKPVPVNVNILIDSIHISPYAPSWFFAVVKAVCEKFNVNKPIVQSEMVHKPFY